jgi:protein-disulfide isomerase
MQAMKYLCVVISALVMNSGLLVAQDAYKVGDKTVTMEMLKKDHASDFFEAEKRNYELIEAFAKEAYLKHHIQEWAKQNKIDSAKAEESFFNAKIKVNEKDIKETLEKYKDNPQLKKMSDKERTDAVTNFLKGNEQRKVVQDVITEGEQKKQFAVLVPKPTRPASMIPVADDEYSLGNPKAKLVVVIFSDFECPYCSKAVEPVHEVEKKFKDQIRIVFKNFPLGMHPNAKPAAEYACCAGEQGKFWEAHDKLFANQQALKEEDLKKYMKDLKLDEAKMDACKKSKKCEAKVNADLDVASKLQVGGTPTFFIGFVKDGGVDVDEGGKTVKKPGIEAKQTDGGISVAMIEEAMKEKK